jgi:hypothetical protein
MKTNELEVPIPSRMRKRPRFQGMVIPFTTWIHPKTHVPDFKVNDEQKRMFCITRRKCAMCGERLNKQIVFIGGPSMIEEGALAIDVGMHPECARYAWHVCPFMITGRGHSEHIRDHSDAGIVLHWNEIATSTAPPERMAMLTTESYEVVPVRGQLFVRPGPAVNIEWRRYP